MTQRLILSVISFVLASCAYQSGRAQSGQAHLSVSGLSAGGYMATQLHLTNSTRIDGVGLLAAGPYGCSGGAISTALGPCLSGVGLDATALAAKAKAAAADDVLDSLVGITADRVWLFHGQNDTVVTRDVVVAAQNFYLALTVPSTAIERVDNVAAAHGLPALDASADCDAMQSPFLNACDYDAAGKLLSFLVDRDGEPPDRAQGVLETIVQPNALGLAKTGFLYRPPQCRQQEHACGVHVVLHGCQQGAQFVGDQFAMGAGYNRWGDALDLMILYPQAERVAMINPLGCWDWWGYSGAGFDTRDGVQIRALMTLIDQVQAGGL